jgi:S1-C subfamily serine protease
VIRGATTIKIVVPGTSRTYAARVVGYDVSDDVAVLQAAGAPNLKTVPIGSATAKLGQAVRAVGNANGTGSLSTASGTVTGLGRAITVNDDQGGSERLTGLIETNAALQPGDSGGPLFNASGRVVGMNTAASFSGYGFRQFASGDGFAIPIGKAVTIATRITTGRSSAAIHVGGTAFLGVQVGSAGYGVVVAAVVPGSPAASAGLAPGDVITSFGGRSLSSPTSLSSLVLAQKPGAHVSLTYLDQTGASHSTTATLASGPPQ